MSSMTVPTLPPACGDSVLEPVGIGPQHHVNRRLRNRLGRFPGSGFQGSVQGELQAGAQNGGVTACCERRLRQQGADQQGPCSTAPRR